MPVRLKFLAVRPAGLEEFARTPQHFAERPGKEDRVCHDVKRTDRGDRREIETQEILSGLCALRVDRLGRAAKFRGASARPSSFAGLAVKNFNRAGMASQYEVPQYPSR